MRVRFSIFLLTVVLAVVWLPARAQSFPPPTPFQYALMSNLAYNPGSSSAAALAASSWAELLRSREDGQNDQFGYFGVAYINSLTHQVVIAHRGTDQRSLTQILNQSIDLDDDLELLRGKIPQQFQQSTLQFISRVYAILHDDGMADFIVTHTGHSLGAALAEMSALTEPVTGAVTFDSPGLLLPTTIHSDTIISYVAAPNFVNTANRHPGRVILVDSNWRSLRAKYFPPPLTGLISPHTFLTSYIRYSVEAHSMDRILAAFDANSGELPQGLDVVRGWPLGVLASFRVYLFPGDSSGLTTRSRGSEALENFLIRLKGIQTDAAFQELVDEYVIRSRRFTDNLSDLYTEVILLTCGTNQACVARSSRDCLIGEISLSYVCVKENAAA